jgi:polysaccharide chain length determinant protein (PEP-CTERM system associated)
MEEREKKLSDHLQALKRRRKLLISVMVVLTAIALGVAFLLPAIYQSRAVILIEQQEIPRELVSSTVTSYADQRIQEITQRVMTTSNLSAIIKKYNLYAEKRATQPLQMVVATMRGDIRIDTISADVVDPMRGQPTKATIAFTVSFESRFPDLAQRVCNELVSLYLKENLTRRTEVAEQAHTFLSDEAERLKKQISELDKTLVAFKEANAGKLPDMMDVNLKLMDRTDQQLLDLDRNIQLLEDRKIYIQGQLATIKPYEPIVSGTGERLLAGADRLEVAEAEYAALSAQLTPNHPDMVRLKREIEALKAEGSSGKGPTRTKPPDNPAYVSLRADLESANLEIASIQAKKIDLNRRLEEYETKLAASPAVEREYRDLMREHDSTTQKYNEITAKQMAAKVSKTLESEQKGERFTLIEPPLLPAEPDRPNRMAIALVGTMLAFAGGVGSTAVAEALDPAIYGRAGLLQLTGVPPIAVIPEIVTAGQRRMRTMIRAMIAAAVLVAIVLALIAIHVFYQPLDVLWFSSLRRFGLE